MKLLSVVGARPQFIKLAPLVAAIQKQPEWEHVVCHTGQHYDWEMSQVFFQDLNLPPAQYHFTLKEKDPLARLQQMMDNLAEVVQKEQPDWLLIFGDTHSTLAGALVGKMLGLKVAHIEAGLRSFNRAMPEEFNRITADYAADLQICTNAAAKEQLTRERHGVPAAVCGDLMLDALQLAQAQTNLSLPKSSALEPGYLLVTLHRQENLSTKRVQRWVDLLKDLAQDCTLVFPVHPRTRQTIAEVQWPANIHLIKPLGYLEMLAYVHNSQAVLTDSGGLQKDAFYLKKPCVTLRTETEWTELQTMGVNRVCDLDIAKVREALHYFEKTALDFSGQPYGDGHSAEKILTTLKNY